MKNKKNYAKNSGFSTIDIIVAMFFIIISVSIIATAFVNYYISTQGKTRQTIATNIVIEIIENVKMKNYDDITEESVVDIVESLNIPSGYTVTTNLQKYNMTEGNTEKQDLIKILNVQVEYSVNKKDEKYEVTTLIKK